MYLCIEPVPHSFQKGVLSLKSVSYYTSGLEKMGTDFEAILEIFLSALQQICLSPLSGGSLLEIAQFIVPSR